MLKAWPRSHSNPGDQVDYAVTVTSSVPAVELVGTSRGELAIAARRRQLVRGQDSATPQPRARTWHEFGGSRDGGPVVAMSGHQIGKRLPYMRAPTPRSVDRSGGNEEGVAVIGTTSGD